MSPKLIYVFGGSGQQGAVVADILAQAGHGVVVFDAQPSTSIRANIKPKLCEVSHASMRKIDFKNVDLVVNALPSAVAPIVTGHAMSVGIDTVDLAFSEASPEQLHECAVKTGARLLYDCGLAPGLPNLIVGHELALADKNEATIKNVDIFVGGISTEMSVLDLKTDKSFGYVNTWSLDDLYEEYTRTARIVVDGEICTKHPLYSSNIELVSRGLSNMGREGFYSDGLRSLLNLKDKIPNMQETTIRRKGHMKFVHSLIDSGGKKKFLEYFRENCSGGEDMIEFGTYIDNKLYVLTKFEGFEHSAMTHTTAYSCAAFCSLLLEKGHGPTKGGVYAPEDIGSDEESYNYIVSWLQENAGFTIEAANGQA